MLCAGFATTFLATGFEAFGATGFLTGFADFATVALPALLAGFDLTGAFSDFDIGFFADGLGADFFGAAFAGFILDTATLDADLERASAFFAGRGLTAGLAVPVFFFATVLVAGFRFKFAIILHHCYAAVACYSLCAFRRQPFVDALRRQVQ